MIMEVWVRLILMAIFPMLLLMEIPPQQGYSRQTVGNPYSLQEADAK